MHGGDWLPPADTDHPDLTAALAATGGTGGTGDASLGVWLCGGGGPRARLAVARSLQPAAHSVARLAGCRSVADALLCVGEAIGAPVRGSAVSIGAHLRQRGPTWMILDDADRVPDPRAILSHLQALAPETRWLCLAAQPPTPDIAAETCHVLPGEAISGEAAWAALPSSVAGLLLLLPAGLPLGLSLGALSHPIPPGRVALCSDVAGRLRGEASPLGQRWQASQEAERLKGLLGRALALAEGGPLHADLRVADLLALRWLGEVSADPDTAARASAAAARLLTAWGQLDGARKLLETSLRRDAQASPAARARLHWAEADTLLASGDEGAASQRHDEAEALLRDRRDAALLATLTRRRADALAVRGHARPAARAYQRAGALSRQQQDAAGLAASLRGLADLALGQGEQLAPAALYDQLGAQGGTSAAEAASQAIGRAGLAIGQGALGQAVSLLADADDPEEPLLIWANRARRRADLALRQGRPSEASQQAQRAIAAYARVGERVSVGHTTRLLGDAAAVDGRLYDAARHYQQAIALQIEVGDLHGLEKTLSHAAILEESAQDAGYGDRLRSFLRSLRRQDP